MPTSYAAPAILVWGDAMLDEVVLCHESGEDNGVKVYAEDDRKFFLGGAANVAANVASLGVKPRLSAAVGMGDEEGALILAMCRNAGIVPDLAAIVARPTTRKTRLFCRDSRMSGWRNNRYVGRIDREMTSPVIGTEAGAIVSGIVSEKFLDDCRVMGIKEPVAVFSDYGKGMCEPNVLTRVMEPLQDSKIPILVDPPKSGQWLAYGGRETMIKFNIAQGLAFLCTLRRQRWVDIHAKVQAAIAVPGYGTMKDASYLELLIAVRQAVIEHLPCCRYVWLTLGPHGAMIMRVDGESDHHHRVQGVAVEALDCTGAGDTSLAAMAVHVHKHGYDWESVKAGAEFANRASSVVCAYIGTRTVTRKDLLLATEETK